MSNAHDSIANALEVLGNTWDKLASAPVAQPVQQQVKVAEDVKVVQAKYRQMTGEDLDPAVAADPKTVAAIRKLASSATPINELGTPAHTDPSVRSNGREGKTRDERRKSAFEAFGSDLLNNGSDR